MPLRREYVEWAMKREIEEHVTLPNFISQFNLSNKDESTEAFRQLIHSPEIRESRRRKLQDTFALFCAQYEERFWAQRELEVSSEVQSKRAGLAAQGAAVAQSDIGFKQVVSTTLNHFTGGQPSSLALSSPFASASSSPGLKRSRTPQNKAANKAARRANSKTKIKEPWHSLIETALLQYDGWQVDLPEIDANIEQESTTRTNLYQVALLHLDNVRTRQAQAHFDRISCLDYKDAFVALSGIWNTYSSSANEVFGQSLTEEAKALCHLQSIDNKDDAFMEITNSLLQKQTLDEIFDETYQLQIAQPTYRRMLDVLQIIIRNIIRPLYGSKAPSEADCIAIWSSIFREGLPLDSHLSMHLGEQGCSASALSKSKLADIFETGTMPRNLDELRFFLGDPVHRLAKLLGHYHEYASQAHRVVKQYQYQKKGEDEEDAVSSTPKYGTETLEWEHVVFHTPTKASKRPSLLEKLKLAKEEGQHDWSEE
ncbi:hypothetical protein BGX33_000699 [Mortierella sp. NVP41]|nr:hypothetical protein BGX33_000699 [Mortierella sp. NVP41]